MEKKTNLNLMLRISFVLAALGICTISNAKIIRVDDSATGANNGTSWTDAYVYLQDALAEAASGDEIRVAHGLYTPGLGGGFVPGDSNASFQLKNGVEIKGGYVGLDIPEKSDERAFNIFETVLSSDVNSPKPPSFVVVNGSNVDETAILDGFTVNGFFRTASGGRVPVYIISGSPTIENCTFVFTSPVNGGRGFYNSNGSNPIITSCTFKGNSDINAPNIKFDVTIMENEQSSPMLTNCTFENNSNTIIKQSGGSLKLENCIFENNSNAIIAQTGGSLKLEYCTFLNNKIKYPLIGFVFSGCINNSGGDLTITDCIFTENTNESPNQGGRVLSSGGGCINNLNGKAIIKNCTFERNYSVNNGSCIDSPKNSNDDSGSTSVINCVFRGNAADDSGGAISGSNMMIQNCRFSGNTSDTGGAISVFASDVHNCIFEANRGDHGSAVSISPESYRYFYNCTFFGNSGGSVIKSSNSKYTLNVTGCILRENESNVIEGDNVKVTYCNIEGLLPGAGNIDVEPQFVIAGYRSDVNDPNSDWVEGDYHLKSQAGHWDSQNQTWILDDITSPCVDAGDPNSPIGYEPFPNGGIYNLGAYGRSLEASKTYFGTTSCGGILAGDINGDCIVDTKDLMIVASQWLLDGSDFINQPPQVTLIEPHDGDQITWNGQLTLRVEAFDADGEIVMVEFYLEQKQGNEVQKSIRSDTDGSNGWQYVLHTNPNYGNWTISATATDNEGAKTQSNKISITLIAP